MKLNLIFIVFSIVLITSCSKDTAKTCIRPVVHEPKTVVLTPESIGVSEINLSEVVNIDGDTLSMMEYLIAVKIKGEKVSQTIEIFECDWLPLEKAKYTVDFLKLLDLHVLILNLTAGEVIVTLEDNEILKIEKAEKYLGNVYVPSKTIWSEQSLEENSDDKNN